MLKILKIKFENSEIKGKLKRLIIYVQNVPLYASIFIIYGTVISIELLKVICGKIIHRIKSSSESEQKIYRSEYSLFSCVLFTIIGFSYGI